jgi:Tol biopolymer transport system component
MLTKAGAKVLDFGLAKIGAGLKSAPAETLPLTEEGVILGTLQYMAPEQLEGKEADTRSDIFAFGAVVYEMTTGRKAFEGKSRASVIAAILDHQTPPLTTVDPMTPAALDRVVKKCLAKDPDRRWQSAQDLRDELQWIAEGDQPLGTLPLPAAGKRAGHRALWIYAALATLTILLLALGYYFRRPVAEVQQVRFSISLPEKTVFGIGNWPALSPDGNLLAFVTSNPSGPRMLWVRRLDSPAAQALAGTEGARYPFWSPDSRFVGFGAQGKLKKIEVGASRPGSPQVLCDAVDFHGAAWNQDGVILFSPDFLNILYRVSATGGVRTPVTALDSTSQEVGHFALQFLPDGRHFLYGTGSSKPGNQAVFVGSLNSPPGSKNQKLFTTDWRVLYAPQGYLLFWRGPKLMAQQFDPDRLRLSGEPVAIAEQAGTPEQWAAERLFSVSTNGLLAYQSSEDAFSSELVWLDRTGKRLGSVARGDINPFFTLSPDQKRLAFARTEVGGDSHIWLSDLARGTATRLTSDRWREIFPVWSPDGRRIIFASNRGGQFDLYEKASTGLGNEEPVLVSNEDKIPNHWSHDGRFLIYADIRMKTRNDLWILPVSTGTTGDRKPMLFVQTEFDEHTAAFSPNGRWIAYCLEGEVFVQSFTGDDTGPAANAGGKWLVSTSGGCLPRWRRDGKELYYLARDGKLMTVEVNGGATFEVGPPRALFEVEAGGGYDAAADGQRFLVRLPLEETVSSPITIVVNWAAALRR